MRAAVLALAVALLALETRALWSGRAELQHAAQATDISEKILHLRRAARWRAPFSPVPRQAISRLAALGHDAADPAVALRVWEGIRGALLATRVADVTDEERLREANEHIAALRAGQPSGDAYRHQLALLERRRATSAAPTALALLGGLAWATGGFCLPRRPRFGWGLLAVGLPAFALGLWLA